MYECTIIIYIICVAEFLKTYVKTAQISAQEPGDSQVSGHCGENKHRGLAVLVGLIVKRSPWANLPWVGKGLPYQSLRGVLKKRRTVR